MNSIENRKNFIENAYRQAVGAGLADSKQDFANKVGVSPVTMSKAMNGAEGYATEKLCEKIKAAFPRPLCLFMLLRTAFFRCHCIDKRYDYRHADFHRNEENG